MHLVDTRFKESSLRFERLCKHLHILLMERLDLFIELFEGVDVFRGWGVKVAGVDFNQLPVNLVLN